MMNCLWFATGNGNEKRCRRDGCTNRLLADAPADECYATCEAVADNSPIMIGSLPKRCIHLDAEVRRENCPTCAGNVLVKVFACSKHGECTKGQPIEALACCIACKDRDPG